jgi:hypothetical protein
VERTQRSGGFDPFLDPLGTPYSSTGKHALRATNYLPKKNIPASPQEG